LASRLAKIDAHSAVKVAGSKRSFRVLVGSFSINVKRAEAQANRTTTASLARVWASQLRAALALPAIRVGATSLDLPPGGVKVVALVGSEALKARIETDASAVVSVKRVPGGIRLKGGSLGKANVVVLGPTGSATVSLRVLPWAANLPQDLTVSVTGAPASKEVVRGAIERAVRTQLKTSANVWVSFDIPRAGGIPSSEARVIAVKVKAGGSECFSVAGTARVTVRNLGLGARSETELWYCNDPESIRKYGNLFAAELRRDKPARLLFHHINESSAPLTVDIRAINASDKAARVVIIPGEAFPVKNPVLAGADAGDEFLRNWLAGSGEVVWLPAHSSIPISIRRLGLKETTSGLCYLRLLDDGPASIYLRADAKEPALGDKLGEASAPWRRAKPSPIPEGGGTRPALNDHVYPHPFRHETVAYAVGGKHGFVFVGEKPIDRADQMQKLEGNFGVVYTIDAEMTNPTESRAQVEIVFQASSGYSGGLFVVDGKVVRCPMSQPKGGFQIWRHTLEPGQSKSCRILTIPLSGSAYPVTITVRTPDVMSSATAP
jgi:hypothetical protein